MYMNYAQTKVNDLYTRMGNAVLSELRQYDKLIKEEKRIATRPLQAKQKLQEKMRYSLRKANITYELKKAMKNNFESVKNQMEFRNLQQSIDQVGQEYEDR